MPFPNAVREACYSSMDNSPPDAITGRLMVIAKRQFGSEEKCNQSLREMHDGCFVELSETPRTDARTCMSQEANVPK